MRICAHIKTFYAGTTSKTFPTFEAMQKMLAFYHKKGIDMLKLGCTLPNLANICLHKSTSAKFYPFTETEKKPVAKNSIRYGLWSLYRLHT